MTSDSKRRRATAAERAQLRHALISAVLTHGQAGTDQAHEIFELPDSVEQRVWGGITGGLEAEGILRRVGESRQARRYRPSVFDLRGMKLPARWPESERAA